MTRAEREPSGVVDTTDLLIWWVTNDDTSAILGEARSMMMVTRGWPDYLRDELRDRHGRPGRGRLWVAAEFGDQAIDPWPEDADVWPADGIAGIVLWRRDLRFIAGKPGTVTDFNVKRVRP